MRRKRFPDILYNPISMVGAGIATVSFVMIVFLMLVDIVTAAPAPYLGIITFILLPAILILGLIIVSVGVLAERRRRHRMTGIEKPPLPRIDLNEPRQRTAFFFFSTGTIVLLLFSAVGSYRAFEFTESVQFCGTLCHEVMNPEYTTYRHSPHARVRCVDCHVGSGASWYVRSKLSGVYQIYAALFDKYPRPIPTPIKNLRPARETCEECHWPGAFLGEKRITKEYFLSDSGNSAWTLDMLLKIGSGTVAEEPRPGVHWHVSNTIVKYIATDSILQVLPWVSLEQPGKKPIIYVSEKNPISDEQMREAKVATVDCMDCHNRPTHIIRNPTDAVNAAMAKGSINPTLPLAKKISVQALIPNYTSEETAFDSIGIQLREYYQQNYPQIFTSRKGDIESAVTALKAIYQENFFPYMRVDWRAYRNNIGHHNTAGCFRCHDGKHKSSDGRVISNDCQTCHVILAQGRSLAREANLFGLPFQHPADVGDAWKTTLCSDCHDGTQ